MQLPHVADDHFFCTNSDKFLYNNPITLTTTLLKTCSITLFCSHKKLQLQHHSAGKCVCLWCILNLTSIWVSINVLLRGKMCVFRYIHKHTSELLKTKQNKTYSEKHPLLGGGGTFNPWRMGRCFRKGGAGLYFFKKDYWGEKNEKRKRGEIP